MSATQNQLTTVNFYNTHAVKLAGQYDSKTFAEVHSGWISHLTDIFLSHSSENSPNHDGKKDLVNVLDIGAGSGRDAKFLAEQATPRQDVAVYAVEPARELAAIGKPLTQHLNVTWLQDSLPALEVMHEIELQFDLILLSAVWMHIAEFERFDSLTRLTQLLAPQGRLIISLRHGPSGDERQMHQVSIKELEALSKTLRLTIIDSVTAETDKLGRAEVHWETVVLKKDNANGDISSSFSANALTNKVVGEK